MLSLQDILDGIRTLSEDEKQVVKAELISRFPQMGDDPDTYLANERFGKGLRCPLCGGTHIHRNGHTPEGRQRYICRECGKTFGTRSRTILAGTRKDIAVWSLYLECMFMGYSLRKTAKVCEISLPTAFHWRHKILDALREVMQQLRLGGVVEADETYLKVSYKGNHSKSKRFTMPRASRHRGGELHQSGISKELVCISCAISRDGKSLASALTLGRASQQDMIVFFDGRLEDGTVLCTDHEPAYHAYARRLGLRHVRLETQEVREGYTIQRINAYHRRLKDFLSGFHGVSTKYLDNYLAWNSARDMVSLRGAEEEAPLLQEALTAPVDTIVRTMRDRPAVPAGA